MIESRARLVELTPVSEGISVSAEGLLGQATDVVFAACLLNPTLGILEHSGWKFLHRCRLMTMTEACRGRLMVCGLATAKSSVKDRGTATTQEQGAST